MILWRLSECPNNGQNLGTYLYVWMRLKNVQFQEVEDNSGSKTSIPITLERTYSDKKSCISSEYRQLESQHRPT